MLNKKILLVLFMVSIIWGIHPSVNKILLAYSNPLSLIAFRFFIASMTLFAYLLYTKQFRIPSTKHLIYFFLLGFISITGTNTTNVAGLAYSTVTNCSLINSVAPLLISLSAFLFFKEKLFALQWFGIIIVALSTVYLITGGNLLQLFEIEYNRGDLIFLSGQVGWAVYTLASSRLLKNINMVEFIAWSCFFGSLINFSIALSLGVFELPIFTPASIVALSFSIWINSMGAVLLWNYGVKHAGSQIASIFINLATLISIFIGIFLLGEEVTKTVVVGTIGILSGILLLTQYKLFLYLYQKMRRFNN